MSIYSKTLYSQIFILMMCVLKIKKNVISLFYKAWSYFAILWRKASPQPDSILYKRRVK